MPTPKTAIEGLPARRAALEMLDAVLRRGQTMDNAAQARRGLPPADAALASAIAGETLRRLPDLDALIDSATRQKLPDDAKARMVLRLALAQKIGLGTPDHALVATALPLVDGGPRRLVHGVLGTLLRAGLAAASMRRACPTCSNRWRAAGATKWSPPRAAPIVQPPAARSQLRRRRRPRAYPLGTSLAPAPSPRRSTAASVAALAGLRRGRLVGPGPRRLAARPPDPGRAPSACSTPAPRPAARRCSSPPPGHDVTALDRSESRLARLAREPRRAPASRRKPVVADALEWTPDAPFDAVLLDAPCSATGTFRRHPEVLYRARPAIIDAERRAPGAAARPRRRLGPARRKPGLCGLLARARGRRGARSTPSSPSGPIIRIEPAPRLRRRRDATCARLAARPARHARGRGRARRLLHRAPCPQAPNRV